MQVHILSPPVVLPLVLCYSDPDLHLGEWAAHASRHKVRCRRAISAWVRYWGHLKRSFRSVCVIWVGWWTLMVDDGNLKGSNGWNPNLNQHVCATHHTRFPFLYHYHVAHHRTTIWLSKHYNQPEQHHCTRDLLSNWPTYVLNYIPEQPGPLVQFPLIYYKTDTDDRLQKIILRLKDVSKHVIEDDNETIESDLEDTKDAPAMVTKQWVKGASITLQLHLS